MRAVALGTKLPRTLQGRSRCAWPSTTCSKFQFGDAATSAILERLYGQSADAGLEGAGHAAFSKRCERSRRSASSPYTPADGAQYIGEFGRRLQQVARLIKADVGVEVAFVDMDGWDHHANEMRPAHQHAASSSARHSPRSRAIWATAWRTS